VLREVAIVAALSVTPENLEDVLKAVPMPPKGYAYCAHEKCIQRLADYQQTVFLLEKAADVLKQQTDYIQKLEGSCGMQKKAPSRSVFKQT
jgi:hypothetical protein